jgi:hypothetical protein
MRLARSYLAETSWKNRFAASGSNGMYPTSSTYADIRIDRPMPTPGLCRSPVLPAGGGLIRAGFWAAARRG